MSNRRKFIKTTSAVGITTLLLPGKLLAFLEQFNFSDTAIDIRNQDQTGKLQSNEIDILWRLYKYIGHYWDTSHYTNISKYIKFSEIINLKTSIKPSYLFEYRSAISQLSYTTTKDKAYDFESFLLKNTDEYSKKFVSLEFFNLNISSGGFKRFGYKNYFGFQGGRFDNLKNLPYRTS